MFTGPLTRRTVIDVCLARQPGESSSAGAHEASACVGAGPTVLAGVRDAFIHIDVTQLTCRGENKVSFPDGFAHNRRAGREIISTSLAYLATLTGSYIGSPGSLVCVCTWHDCHRG